MAKPRVKKIHSPKVTIHVGEEQIYEAEQHCSSHCMIAESIKLCVPGATGVSVDLQTIRWSDLTLRLRYTYLTPRIAQTSLINFDQGIPCQPYSFQLTKAIHIQIMGPPRSHGRKLQTIDKAKENARRIQKENNGQSVVTIIGGSPPPIANVAYTESDRTKRSMDYLARRRSFGLKALRP